MFGKKAARIKELEQALRDRREENSEDFDRYMSRQADFEKQIDGLVRRLYVANPAISDNYRTYLDFSFFTYAESTLKPQTKKAPEPKDETPMGDLKRYVESKEREKKNKDAKAAEEAKQKEIRRLADEEVAKHVAKLHKSARKKK